MTDGDKDRVDRVSVQLPGPNVSVHLSDMASERVLNFYPDTRAARRIAATWRA